MRKKTRGSGVRPPRARSAPPAFMRLERSSSIMRVATLEESLHSSYEQSRSGTSEDGGVSSGSLTFANVLVREYARAVGDNPSVSSGPPISIGWEHTEEISLSLDDYESDRGPRRSSHEMAIPRSVRLNMLMNEWKVSQSEIAQSVRDTIRTKNRRRTTVQNLDRFARAEELAESFRRKCRRVLLRQKKSSAMYEEWKSQFERASIAIAQENAASESSSRVVATVTKQHRNETVLISEKDENFLVGEWDEAGPAEVVKSTPSLTNKDNVSISPQKKDNVSIPPQTKKDNVSIAPQEKKKIICQEDDSMKEYEGGRKDIVPEQGSGLVTFKGFGPTHRRVAVPAA